MKGIPTILIIDDDPNNRRLLQLDLEDISCNVLEAEDGMSGWETLQQHKKEVKIILLDYMMPNMNGIEFMSKLNSDNLLNNIPVIMQTAIAEDGIREKCLEVGIYYHLIKPYDTTVLLTIIKTIMDDCTEHASIRSGFKD